MALSTLARIGNAPHLLTGPFPKGNALLHGGDHGAGERGLVVDQGIIAWGHGGVDARPGIPGGVACG